MPMDRVAQKLIVLPTLGSRADPMIVVMGIHKRNILVDFLFLRSHHHRQEKYKYI